MNNKSKYLTFCEENKSVPLFMRADWLNCLDLQWDVAFVEKGGKMVAVMPYLVQSKFGFKISPASILGTYDGIWIKYPEDQKESSRLSYEKELISELLNQLPQFDQKTIKLHPSITNHLPFYWNGYKQTTKYTYVIDDLSDMDSVIEGFNGNIRREIKKAEKDLLVEHSFNPQLLYDLKTKDQRDPVTYSLGLMERIISFCETNNTGEQLIAKDKNGSIHASILFVWDQEYCYYVIGGSYPEFRTSGAMSLLMLEGIKLASKKSAGFNFCGSMVENIERFFRGFGARQLPYFEVEKTPHKLLKLLLYLRKRFKNYLA